MKLGRLCWALMGKSKGDNENEKTLPEIEGDCNEKLARTTWGVAVARGMCELDAGGRRDSDCRL